MIIFMRRFLRQVGNARGSVAAKVALATLAIFVFSASGFLFFEAELRPDLTWSDAFWWAFVTMTTVGYGDLFPETAAGRYIVAFPAMIFGISVLGYLLSAVASALLEAHSRGRKGVAKILMKKHILIVHYPGLERVENLVQQLRADVHTADSPIVLVDANLEELPVALAELGIRFVRGDASKESTLRQANVENAERALVLALDAREPHSDNHTLAAVLVLEQLNEQVHTVAECIDPEHIGLLKRAGADSVVCLSELSTNLLIQESVDPGVQEVVHEITSNTRGQQIYMLQVGTNSTFGEARASLSEQGALVLGVRREGGSQLNPSDSFQIHSGDGVICLAAKRPSVAL